MRRRRKPQPGASPSPPAASGSRKPAASPPPPQTPAAGQPAADQSRSAARSAARARVRAAAVPRQSGRAHRRLGSRAWAGSGQRHAPAENPVSSPPPAAPPRRRCRRPANARRAPNPSRSTKSEPSSLRAKLMKRVKSLFIAASIVAVVVGSIQIAGNGLRFRQTRKPQRPRPRMARTRTPVKATPRQPPSAQTGGARQPRRQPA